MTIHDDDQVSGGVGYGRPPMHSRFWAGESGNPKGRPKGKLPLSKLIEKYLDGKITVTVGGKPKTITRREFLTYGFIGDALNNKAKVRKQLLDMLLMFESKAPLDPQSSSSEAEDDAIIATHLKRLGVLPAAAPSKPPVRINIIKTKSPEKEK